jgi:sec-independent protein translocase protein TatA
VTVPQQQQIHLNSIFDNSLLRGGYYMLEGWEWLIIGVVAIVIILWGPAKIPEFAKALGRAKGEFSKASKEFENAATMTAASAAPAAAQTTVASTGRSKDEVLLETARNLGISTNGRTREQIAEEISARVKSLGAA